MGGGLLRVKFNPKIVNPPKTEEDSISFKIETFARRKVERETVKSNLVYVETRRGV